MKLASLALISLVLLNLPPMVKEFSIEIFSADKPFTYANLILLVSLPRLLKTTLLKLASLALMSPPSIKLPPLLILNMAVPFSKYLIRSPF